MKDRIGRHMSFVECRESRGLGVGGGMAQRATISESGRGRSLRSPWALEKGTSPNPSVRRLML